MDKRLEVCRLSAGYGRGDVLQSVSFSLGFGELCAVLGANGSGKSTLLRAVCGLLPFRGRCLLEGRDIPHMPRRQAAQLIGYLGQCSGAALSLSALDMVLMGYHPILGPFQAPSLPQRGAPCRCWSRWVPAARPP
jgi:iron complex transport system ATP-binding protein